jgi:hypothetical protein
MKIYIVALTRQQADDYARETFANDYIFLSGDTSLKGVADPVVLFVRDWIKRIDLERVFLSLLTSTNIDSTRHRAINQLWGEWKTYHDSQIKCIVKDCNNKPHLGKFVGDLCSPCNSFITKGEGTCSQAYRNAKIVGERELGAYQLIQEGWNLGMQYGKNIDKENKNSELIAELSREDYLNLLKRYF